MAGTVRLTQTRDGKSVSVPGVLLVEWPDRLRLEVQDPVGGMLVLLLVEGERFWLYQRDRKENLMGPLRSLPAGLSLPFRSEDLVRVFLARPYLERFEKGKVEARAAEAAAGEGRGKEFLRWSDRFSPEEWAIETAKGEALTARYESYAARDGALYPTKLRLSREKKQSALFVWEDWEPRMSEKKLFQIPPSQAFGRPTKALP